MADDTKIIHTVKFTKLLLRDTPNIKENGNSWAPDTDGNTFLTGNIVLYPETEDMMSGTVYFDIPDGRYPPRRRKPIFALIWRSTRKKSRSMRAGTTGHRTSSTRWSPSPTTLAASIS